MCMVINIALLGEIQINSLKIKFHEKLVTNISHLKYIFMTMH